MSRLFEFGDKDWVPDWYHKYLRIYLVIFYRLYGYYKLWIPPLKNFLKHTNATQLMEYCSGSGDVMRLIASELDKSEFEKVTFVLSDIRPHPDFVEQVNSEHSGNRFAYIKDSVDAVSARNDIDLPKIFVNSFHHFGLDQAEKVIGNNLCRGNEIVILEYVSNTFLGYISMIFGSLSIFLTLPFVVRAKDLPLMLFVTYIFPIFPLMVFWDGVVSCAHAYSEKQLSAIVKKTDTRARVTKYVRRSLLFPAGVTVFTITFPEVEA